MTRAAFENAIRTLHLIGGSTNAVIHLVAIAGRVGVDLPLDLFDELSASTPMLVNLKPSGAYLMEDFFYAGGLPAALSPGPRPAPSRRANGDRPDAGRRPRGRRHHRRRGRSGHASSPLGDGGSLVILRGNLCPDGAVLKRSAASELAAPARGSGGRLPERGGAPRHHRRSGARHHARRRPGAPERGTGRRAGHARVGASADPCPPASPGGDRHGADQRCPHERDRIRHGGAAYRARVGRSGDRSAWCQRATGSGWTRRAGVSTCWSPTTCWPTVVGRGYPRHRRRSAAIAVCISGPSCRPTGAATSTSWWASPRRKVPGGHMASRIDDMAGVTYFIA